jgi:hypothetical protein
LRINGWIQGRKEKMMRRARWWSILTLVPLALPLSCGPKEPPRAGGQQQVLVEDTGPVEEQIDPAVQARIDELVGMVNEINEAIAKQDKDAFWAKFTERSHELFIKVALLDMAIAGIKDVEPSDHILKQQKDFNVVYTLEDVDPGAMKATLVGVMRDTGDEVRFPIGFVEKDGKLLFDYTDVLSGRLDNLKVARMRALVAELNASVDGGDAALYASILTAPTLEGCPDFFGLLPKKGKKPPKTEAVLKSLQKIDTTISLVDIDPTTNTATLKATTDGGEPVTLAISFVIEGGIIKIDAASACSE